MPKNRTEPTDGTTIVVAADASPPSQRAVAWCAQHARALGAACVVVVHTVHLPYYTPCSDLGPLLAAPVLDNGGCEHLRALVTDEWCRPLREAGLEHHVILLEGATSVVLRLVAEHEQASVVVVGATGELAPQLHCPLVVIP